MLAISGLLACVAVGHASAATLPISFSAPDSLGALNSAPGTYIFDTDPITGGSPFGGGRIAVIYSNVEPGGLAVRVFDFDSIQVGVGVRVRTARGLKERSSMSNPVNLESSSS